MRDFPFLSSWAIHPVDFDSLPGWAEDPLKTAPEAWASSCKAILSLPGEAVFSLGTRAQDWQEAAHLYLTTLGYSQTIEITPETFRAYLTSFFQPCEIMPKNLSGGSLFTGYYEPELDGSLGRTSVYRFPFYKRPSDLLVVEDLGVFRQDWSGQRLAGLIQAGPTLVPAPSRADINKGALDHQNLELFWVQDQVALYWAHVQGSARLVFKKTGDWTRLGYDGTNGHPYVSLRAKMIERCLLSVHDDSLEKMKNVLQNHPSPEKRNEIFADNPSYIFFKDLGKVPGPLGRLGSPLVPGRSLALDPDFLSLGTPLWIGLTEKEQRPLPVSSSFSPQAFMTAQDVGGAIKGQMRGDIFCGTGEQAGIVAGKVRHSGRLFILVPRSLSQEK